jgi:hypothetical protein
MFYFCRPWNGNFGYILWPFLVLLSPFGVFYLHLVQFTSIWYIFYLHLVYIFPHWYVRTKQIWQPFMSALHFVASKLCKLSEGEWRLNMKVWFSDGKCPKRWKAAETFCTNLFLFELNFVRTCFCSNSCIEHVRKHKRLEITDRLTFIRNFVMGYLVVEA